MQPPDPAVCAKYACSSAHTSTTGSNVATLISTVNDTNVVYADDEAMEFFSHFLNFLVRRILSFIF